MKSPSRNDQALVTAGLGAAALLDQLASAVLVLDGALRIRYLNSATEMLFGASARRLMDTPLHALVSQGESLTERLLEALSSEAPYTERELHLNLESMVDPASVVVDCMVTPIRLTNGARALLLELHQQDRHLRISREENLQTQQQASRLMLRGLAHEIKNPLGGIRGAAQLLAMELDSKELTEYTQVIIHEADRLQALVDRLLAPHRRPQVVGDVNIHEICERVRSLVLAEYPRGLKVVRDYDTSIPEFRGDREQLIQAVLNIAHNATQALAGPPGESPYSGRIARGDAELVLRSRIARQATFGKQRFRLALELHIQDNGPGVPEAIRDRIFSPLVSGRDGGSGLGLTLAQTFVQQHHGTIDCDSVPGRTVFKLLIPLP
jgi:two-component system nitrogen regulation sensor histidine kinase GlnL